MNTKRIDEYEEKSRLNHKSYCIFWRRNMLFKKKKKPDLKKYAAIYRQGYQRAAVNADEYFLGALNALTDGDTTTATDILKKGTFELAKMPETCLISLEEE